MRILYFSRDYTPHDHRFLSALAQLEHEVYYLRLERRGQALEDRSLPPQVEQVAWAGGQDEARMRDGFRLLRGLKRVIHQVNPHVIHAGPVQTAAFLVALSGFKRLVSMSWGYDLLYDVNRGRVWRWATRYTLQRSAALVADCETVRRQAEIYGMEPGRIVVFPWGVDLTHFAPEDWVGRSIEAQKSFTLLSTRNWEPIYGVDILAQAFADAAKIHPELHLVMTGNGSLAGELRQIFQRAGVTDRVSFPGYVSQIDLPRFYRAADIYVSASHVDGSSISLLEAFACGCPALVSDIPGNLEWVTPGEQGWAFPDGDAQALAAAISFALHNRSRLGEMGHAARSLAERRANWQTNYYKLEQAYQMAMNGNE